ncbi:MAG: hypothetical protein ACJ8FY_11945 [Gemmataceae bacterium]
MISKDKNPTGSNHPEESSQMQTYYSDGPYFLFDGPEDTTVRPRPNNVPRYWPHGIPFPEPMSLPPSAEES